jgi:L-ribulose-5-phosphate 4-epimerase
MLEQLKEEVLQSNLDLVKHGLVVLTWRSVSGIDRATGLVVIKPSGVDYSKLKVEDMIVVDLNGKVLEGDKNPSSDTPTHVGLYNVFPKIGGITHTHSKYATMFAQSCTEIPWLDITHADDFYRSIPVTRFLSEEEVETRYELNTGKIIAERFKDLNPVTMPAVFVGGHAPFAFGKNAKESVRNALILGKVAKMTLGSFQLNPAREELPKYILEKHYQRKHGANA